MLTVLSVFAAACGSGDDRLSAREYARQATTVCARADRRSTAVDIPPLDQRGSADAITRLIAIERQTIDDLHDLRPPRGMQSQVDEWLATVDQLVVEAEFLRESLRHGNRHLADAIAIRAARLSLRSQVLAGRLGVRGCTLPTPPPVDPSSE